MSDVPKKFQPEFPEEEINITVSNNELADSQAGAQSAMELGMVPLSRQAIAEIRQIGVEVEKLGSIQMADGFTFITQQTLAQCMQKISELVASGKELHKCAHSLGYLATAMNKCNATMKAAGAKRGRPADRTGVFNPGTVVNVNTMVVQKHD